MALESVKFCFVWSVFGEEMAHDDSSGSCLRCGLSFATFDDEREEEHLRNCLRPSQEAMGCGLTEPTFFCVLCDIDLSKRRLKGRCQHLKRCSRKSGCGIKQLLEMVAPVEEDEEYEYEAEDNEGEGERENEVEGEQIDENTEPAAANVEPLPPKVNAFTFMMQSSRTHAALAKSSLGGASGTHKRSAPAPANAFSVLMGRTGHPPAKKVARAKAKKGRNGSMFERKRNAAGEVSHPPPHKLLSIPAMTHPIVVDGFQYAARSLTDCYFLTHFHADHYGGLSRDFDYGRIFCTPATAALVKLRLRPEKGCIIPLEYEREYSITVGGVNVKVNMLQANHCPGAACILFRFDTGKEVLHVGDFRWDSAALLRSSSHYLRLQRAAASGINKHLTVYLDTTYCDEKYVFPSQQDSIDMVTRAVREEAEKPGRTLFFFGAYSIGKEKVFMAAAEALGSKVLCDNSRRRAMMCFNWTPTRLARVTTNPADARVWVGPMGQLNFNSMQNTLRKASTSGYTRVVAFRPTGWSFDSSPTISCRTKGDALTLYSVPYSEHSSYSELIDFVQTFKPYRIVPTVNTSKDSVKAQLDSIRKKCNSVYS